MVIIIILIALLIISVVMMCIENELFEVVGLLLTIFTTVLLILSIIFMICKPFEYKRMIAKREGIVQTLSKTSLSEIERAGVVSKIIEFNQELELYKSFNKTFIIGDFISDKFEDMQPIN